MAAVDETYRLEDRYARERGRVYLTGVQALVRLPLEQRRRDAAAGLDTAGFISGYRGSPLGTYDMALWQAREQLEQAGVRFEPGVNEDLAATAVWGSQQAGLMQGARHDGVFGIWYGKGPGVDRSCDALKHANYAGTAPLGGVLALAGDDPGAKSSSIAHQSEHALIHCGIPVLNPSSVQEYLDLGLHGFALSRHAGCWVGFKCLTDTVDSAASVSVDPDRVRIVLPEGPTPDGLHIGWTNIPLQVEHRLYQQRLPRVQAYVRANGIDRVALDAPRRRLGIVTAGKAYLDVRQALVELGIDDARAADLGLCIYKVGMTWPLEPEGLREFARGLEDLLVVEEKRPILEDQIARVLYNEPEHPRLLGKRDESGASLVPSEGELAPDAVAAAIRSWLERRLPDEARHFRPPPAPPTALPPGRMRLPAFCSGCPHSTSTVVPEGSAALGGIGCHGMAVWLPGRNTLAVTQMGGEGANWIGIAPFTDTPHIFQNIGDGTYFHSGLLAVRAAVTANVPITYKVLVNGAVAMTGGQPIEGEPLEGEITVPEVARQLAAEGVQRIAVVGPEPDKYPKDAAFPKGTSFHHRDEIDRVQRELRESPGVSALVYDQTCAAEARRLRRRNAFPDPDRRIVIHEGVCEGCGDCSVQSNCISIEPVETELGRKRRINQSSCNKDFTCTKGYCPSFVSVIGGRVRKAEEPQAGRDEPRFATLPLPEVAACDEPFNVLLAGIGGSGVVTAGAILAMAAHLEGKGCSELDVTGLAQKNGPVASHVRIASDPDRIFATRVTTGAADLALGCDLVVATSFENLPRIGKGRTTAVMNSSVAPTADFAGDPDLDLSSEPLEKAVREAAGEDLAHFVPAGEWATALLGDAIGANLLMLGYAFQRGRLPVGLPALQRAIELNGRTVERNLRAFQWGRLAAHDRAVVEAAVAPLLRGTAAAVRSQGLDEVIAHREAHLTDYQGRGLARRYRALVDRARAAEEKLGREGLALAVARGYAKLLAVKDEYEVARLFSDGSLERQLAREFEGDYRLRLHLSPQFLPDFLAPRDARTGRIAKWELGPWMLRAFRALAKLRFLRGTPLDLPGRTAHRRLERRLADDYEHTLDELLPGLNDVLFDDAVEIASLPEQIRGFDTVKEESIERVQSRRAELLEAFRDRHTGG